MARLTAEQWERAKADYEVGGLKQSEIVGKYGISKGTLSDKVRKESWNQGKTELTELKKTNAVIDLISAERQTELLNRTEQAVLDTKIANEIAFRSQNDDDMNKVRDKAMDILKSASEAKDVKALMDALRIQRESRLGKQPSTAIQINNNSGDSISELMKEISNDE